MRLVCGCLHPSYLPLCTLVVIPLPSEKVPVCILWLAIRMCNWQRKFIAIIVCYYFGWDLIGSLRCIRFQLFYYVDTPIFYFIRITEFFPVRPVFLHAPMGWIIFQRVGPICYTVDMVSITTFAGRVLHSIYIFFFFIVTAQKCSYKNPIVAHLFRVVPLSNRFSKNTIYLMRSMTSSSTILPRH